MKFYSILLLICLANNFCFAQKTITPLMRPDSILNKVYQKLNNSKNLEYTSMRELNYSSENYRNLSSWNVYFDFQSKDSLIGFKYQIGDSVQKQFFNGTEMFNLKIKQKGIQIDEYPQRQELSNHSALYNSILTLKNILSSLVTNNRINKTTKDTLINGKEYLLVNVGTGNLRIQPLGNGFDTLKSDRNFIYKIIVDKHSYLPQEIIQANTINNDFIKTRFTDIKTNSALRPELSWFYSTYTSEYNKESQKPAIPFLKNGCLAPKWELESYNSRKKISLNSLRGKVVLLDFWIKNCGPCIQSVPHLNNLLSKFKNKEFSLVSINSYDSKDDVIWFCDKFKVNYPVLLNGKSVAEQYGVSGFPSIVLIDKKGKIFYSNAGFDQLEIEKLIRNAL